MIASVTTEAPTYPIREPFFALRFVRLLSESGAAGLIGPEAAWLCAVIADVEDATRYRGPITFFNEPLRHRCGFDSEGRLIRARRKATEGGWLHYEPGAKRRPGTYWCLQPIPFQNGSESEEKESGFTSKIEANPKGNGRIHFQNGSSNVALLSYPKEPIPKDKENPLPPKGGSEGERASEKTSRRNRTSKPAFDPSTVPLPPDLDVPAFREAWGAYCRHRAELPSGKAKPLTQTAVETQLKRLAKLDLQAAIEAVEISTANGWVGIHQSTKGTNGRHHEQRIGPGQKHDPHAAEKDPRHGTWT